MKAAANAKKLKPTKPAGPDPEQVRAAVALWYTQTKTAMNDLFQSAQTVLEWSRTPGHPVAAILDADEVWEFAQAVEKADGAIMDMYPRIGPRPADLSAIVTAAGG